MFKTKFRFTGERASLRDIGGINLARYKFIVPFVKNKKVLELGCGLGYGTFFLTENGAKKVLAYDADIDAISFAKRNFMGKRVNYRCAKIENIKNVSDFDVVVSFEVIEHLVHPEKLLSLAKIALKKNGKFILSTPNRLKSSYDKGKPSNPFHAREYSPKELFDLLKEYFGKVELYGIFLVGSKRLEEKKIHDSWRWKMAAFMVRKRWVRRLVNYIPEAPKRFITGEMSLDFKPEDYKFLKRNLNQAPYLVAVCRP